MQAFWKINFHQNKKARFGLTKRAKSKPQNNLENQKVETMTLQR